MKKLLKRSVAVMLSLCLVLVGLTPMQTLAATKKAPTKITLNTTSTVVNVKGTTKLYVKSVTPSTASKSVKWTTSNKKVATVTSKGVVKGIKAGTTYVTATSTYNKKVYKRVKITVVTPTIKLNKKNVTIQSIGSKNKAALKATVKGQSKTVTWKSSNSKIASVDKNGVVTAKKKGTVTITATANGKKTTCRVKVYVPSIAISKSSATIYTPGNGKTVTLKAYYNGKTKTAKWSTSNSKIATVSSKGVVTAKKAGTVTITAKIGSKKVTCKVYVKAQSLTISKTSTKLTVGKSTTLKAVAKGMSTKVTWSTSNSKYATVSSKGVVYGKKAGTVTIYAKANGLTKTCKVTVVAAVKPTVTPTTKPTVTPTPPTPPTPVAPKFTVKKSAESYTVKYDGSQGYKPVEKTVSMSDVDSYKALYFDKVVTFMDNNKEDIYAGWTNAKDFDQTIGSANIVITKVDAATKDVTVTRGQRVETVRINVTETATKNVFNVAFTRNGRTVTFSGVKFEVVGSDYAVTFAKAGVTYKLTVAANGKKALFQCGKDTVASYEEKATSYVFDYDTDLLNGFSVNVLGALDYSTVYKLGDILDHTTITED